jgi:hypothetical protein
VYHTAIQAKCGILNKILLPTQNPTEIQDPRIHHYFPSGAGLRDIPRKSCSGPSFDWWYNILILVRGTGIPMYFLFLSEEYYSYPHSAGRNNIPARLD